MDERQVGLNEDTAFSVISRNTRLKRYCNEEVPSEEIQEVTCMLQSGVDKRGFVICAVRFSDSPWTMSYS